MSRILDCPISKVKPAIKMVQFAGVTIHYFLYCNDCGLPGSIASTRKKAIGNWNQMVRERNVEYERKKAKIRTKYRT